MLNNKKKIFIYNLGFDLSKLYTNTQQDQKAKLDYLLSMFGAYMAGGEDVGLRGFKMFCQRGQNFYAPEGTSGGILKSHRQSISPSVRYKSCLSDIS